MSAHIEDEFLIPFASRIRETSVLRLDWSIGKKAAEKPKRRKERRSERVKMGSVKAAVSLSENAQAEGKKVEPGEEKRTGHRIPAEIQTTSWKLFYIGGNNEMEKNAEKESGENVTKTLIISAIVAEITVRMISDRSLVNTLVNAS